MTTAFCPMWDLCMTLWNDFTERNLYFSRSELVAIEEQALKLQSAQIEKLLLTDKSIVARYEKRTGQLHARVLSKET